MPPLPSARPAAADGGPGALPPAAVSPGRAAVPASGPAGGAMPWPLLVLLSTVNLVIGTAVFIITSVLPDVAAGLGVSVAAAGQAMSAYALSTALLSPLLLMATGRWPRRRALVLGLALFTAGNAVCAVAPSLAVLLAGRVLMGLGAMFTPLAAGIVLALTPPAARGRALGIVFLGISLAYVVGLPLGTTLAQANGWRAPIVAVTAASALALVAVAWRVPREVDAPGASFAGLGAMLRRADVRAVLSVTLLYFTAIFLVFSYIVPVLQALVAPSPRRLALTLLLFGLSGVTGTLVGGWANDRFGPRATLAVQLSLLASMMALLPLTAGQWPLTAAVLVAWGTAGFGMMAPQQTRLAALAPAQAPLLLSLNTSMLYLGTAGGAVLGALATPLLGAGRLSWAGAPLALCALATVLAGARARGNGDAARR